MNSYPETTGDGRDRAVARSETKEADGSRYLTLALEAEDAGRLELAVFYLTLALLDAPERHHFHFHLGLLHGKGGAWVEAARSFRNFLMVRPERADAHFYFALTLFYAGELDEAERGFRRSFALEPDAPADWYLEAARFMQMQGRRTLARKYYRKGRESTPQSVEAATNGDEAEIMGKSATESAAAKRVHRFIFITRLTKP